MFVKLIPAALCLCIFIVSFYCHCQWLIQLQVKVGLSDEQDSSDQMASKEDRTIMLIKRVRVGRIEGKRK